MSEQQLTGRIAVVTGASAGIGEATARRLAREGAAVVVNARREERVAALAGAIEHEGGRAIGVAGDCADSAVVCAMLDAAKALGGREADLVVVNAGRGLSGSVMTSEAGEWDEMVRTNVLGAALLIREAGKRMIAQGPDAQGDAGWVDHPRDIVVLGSVVGINISPYSSMYGSTKFAIGSIAEGARRELGPRGIRVTLVCPGIVESEFQAVAGYDPAAFGKIMDTVGPVLCADDIAGVVSHTCGLPARVCVGEVVVRATRQDYP